MRQTGATGSRRPKLPRRATGEAEAANYDVTKAASLIIDCKYANELPKPPVPKLLKALPEADRLCEYAPTSLELDHRPFLLSEQELVSRVELVDPDAYGELPAEGSMPPPPPPLDGKLLRDDDAGEAVQAAERKRRRLQEKTEAWHRQAFGLQVPQLVTNDVFTERQRYTTGMAAAEKKLSREAPGFTSVEDLTSRIEFTFAAAQHAPVHPSKPSLRPKRVMSVVPDAVLWANKYRQIVFDELPPVITQSARNPSDRKSPDLLFRTAPTPRATCFSYFSPAETAESYRLSQNYFWDNRGGFTRSSNIGEGEALLLSFPDASEVDGEVRFITTPTLMKLTKQKARQLDLLLETQVLSVSYRDPSPQEAAEEQQRMNVVLVDEAGVEQSEASLDYIDGEWQIRGDPRSATGSGQQAQSPLRHALTSNASNEPSSPASMGASATVDPRSASLQTDRHEGRSASTDRRPELPLAAEIAPS